MKTRSVCDILAGVAASRVLVHAVTSVGKLWGVDFNDGESHRALLMARPDDVVVVPSPLDAGHAEHLRSLGIELGLDRIVVAAGPPEAPLPERLLADRAALGRIAELLPEGPVVLDPFVAGPREARLAERLTEVLGRPVPILGSAPGPARAASFKDRLRRLALAAGVPVAPGEIVGEPEDIGPPDAAVLAGAIRRQLGRTGRAVMKGAIGASGSATFVMDDEGGIDAALRAVAERPDNSTYLVEALLNLACSPNVSVWIDQDDGEVSLASVTDQRLDPQLVFVGSAFPSTARRLPQMLDAAGKLVRVLHGEGLRGWVGFDFGEYENATSGERRFFVSEVNPRTNGGLYAKALLERVQARQQRRGRPVPEAYATAHLRAPGRDFASVRACCGDLLFDPGSGRGAAAMNPGRLRDGKLSVACLGADLEEVYRLEDELRERVADCA